MGNGKASLEKRVWEALKNVYDPEIPVNVVDLGLVYGVEISDDRKVKIRMTLTAPGCPLAGYILMVAREEVTKALPEIDEVEVELVVDPPWDPSRVTPEGREALKRLFGRDIVADWMRRMEALKAAEKT